MQKKLCIISSAMLLAIAFFFPSLVGWLVFVFLIPLFYSELRDAPPMTFWDGLLWGSVYWALHVSELLFLCMHHTDTFTASVLYVLFIIYCACHAGLWFFITALIIRRYSAYTWWRLGMWVVTTWLYFIWMRYRLFWPFEGAGYCFGLPLLPLAAHPSFLWLLPVIGSERLLLSMICFSACATYWLYRRSIISLLASLFFFIPFGYGWIVKKGEANVRDISLIGYVEPLPASTEYPLEDAQQLNKKMRKLLEARPEKKIIVMPESSFPFPLNEYPEAVHLWLENALADDIILLIGSQRSQDQRLYNSLYLISLYGVFNYYDKKFLMPFTEFTPYFWKKYTRIHTIFLKDKKEFSSNKSSPQSFSVFGYTFRPFICSDLFCGPPIENTGTNEIMLCLVHDRWCTLSSTVELMFLCARYTAIEQQADILYVGHCQGIYISKQGTIRIL